MRYPLWLEAQLEEQDPHYLECEDEDQGEEKEDKHDVVGVAGGAGIYRGFVALWLSGGVDVRVVHGVTPRRYYLGLCDFKYPEVAVAAAQGQRY